MSALSYGRQDQRPYDKADIRPKLYIHDYHGDHLTHACTCIQILYTDGWRQCHVINDVAQAGNNSIDWNEMLAQ